MARTETRAHPEDLPWNDEPGDPLAWPAGREPEPAEVDTDEDGDRIVDRSHPVVDDSDLNRRQTLDERLRAEEPDRPARFEEQPEGLSLQEGETGEDDVEEAERDPDSLYNEESDELPAEEAALHVVSDQDI